MQSGLSITINTEGAVDRRLRDHGPPGRGRRVDARARVGSPVAFRAPMTERRASPSSSTRAAGGGRAATVLPEVEAALRRHGSSTTSSARRASTTPGELARAAVDAGEIAVTLGGDGLVGLRRRRPVGDRRRARRPARRAGERLRAHARDPAGSGPGLRRASSAGSERLVDVGDVDGRPFIGIASCGFDSEANRIANETKLVKGDLVYAYGALRALAALEAGALRGRPRRPRAPGRSRATAWVRATRRPTAAACSWLRTRSSTMACSTS